MAGTSRGSDSPIHVLRLCQLVSPSLPIGAYSYSQGLEYAAAARWVRDERTASDWILGQAEHTLAALDIPVFGRLYAAWESADLAAVARWSRFLQASRESAELRAEDRHLGSALARLLDALGIREAAARVNMPDLTFASMFALACVRWHIPREQAAWGYLWTWTENQVAAAVKLVPLGQTAGQRILSQAIERIPQAVAGGLAMAEADIGAVAAGLGIASARHETQYTRLFRS